MAEIPLSHFVFRPWVTPYYLACGVVGTLTVLVLFRGRGAIRRTFLALLVAVAASLAGTGTVLLAADAPTALRLIRLSQALSVFITPIAMEFVAELTGRRMEALRRFAWAGGVLACVLSLATPWVIADARVFPYGFTGTAGPLYPAVLGEMSLAGSLPLVLAAQLRAEQRPLQRRQLVLVMLASFMSALAFVDALPVIGVAVPPLGWAPFTIAALLLLGAIVRHRLLDVRLAAWRLVLWLGLTIVGALPFVVLALPFRRLLMTAPPLPVALWFAGLVLCMRAYLLTAQPRIERLIGRRRHDLELEMRVLGNQAATLQTIEDLGRAVDRFLAALDRRLAALVIIDADGRSRVALSAWGSVPAPDPGSPLLTELARVRAPISYEEARGPVRLEIERACVRWGAEYLGPLVDGDELLGLIAISHKLGGGLADMVEMEALDRMCVAVTSALTGARLYQRLRELSGELEQKAAARSESLARTLADLRGAEARLVQSEKLASLGQIVSGVARDLRDQVQTVFDSAGQLRAEAEVVVAEAERARQRDPRLAEARFDEISRDMAPLLDAVAEGARRASTIARDLYGFAPADGAVEARTAREPARAEALVESTLTLLGSQLAEVRVVRRYDRSLPAVPVEAGPIGQVILNLVINAVQAMQGAGTLTLTTRRDGDQVVLSVSDTGPGISAEVLPHIFEPFFSTKGPSTGTGLGLSVSFGIVQRHGGRIAVDSAVGQGTTFHVYLPT
jgi:signal transduction histidine kinase